MTLPVLVSHRTYLSQMKGEIIIEKPTRFGVKIGFGEVGIFDKQRSRSIWKVTGKLVFKGKANIGHGSKISVSGKMEIGEEFSITAESTIVCEEKITFGRNVLISWDTLIMDTDFHSILDESGQRINENQQISIEDYVWIGCRCTILKGTLIPPQNIIAANSVVTSNFKNCNSVIGGIPAKTLKENIYWEK